MHGVPLLATWSALASTAPLHTCWWRTRTPPCAARQDARKSVAVSWVRSIAITPQSFGDKLLAVFRWTEILLELEGSAGMEASSNIRDFGVEYFVLLRAGQLKTITDI